MDTQAFESAIESAREHAQEIANTRVGGFGGSDAKMFYKVGCKGLSALSNTDLKRIAVAMGTLPTFDAESRENSPAQQAGHDFEDWVGSHLLSSLHGVEVARRYGVDKVAEFCKMAKSKRKEQVLTNDLAINFKTFAHADYYIEAADMVIECKYSQKQTAQVISTYMPQLQWYYLMGAQSVTLLHGWGDIEPMMVDDFERVKIELDDDYIRTFVSGIILIDRNWQTLEEMIYERGIAQKESSWLV